MKKQNKTLAQKRDERLRKEKNYAWNRHNYHQEKADAWGEIAKEINNKLVFDLIKLLRKKKFKI